MVFTKHLLSGILMGVSVVIAFGLIDAGLRREAGSRRASVVKQREAMAQKDQGNNSDDWTFYTPHEVEQEIWPDRQRQRAPTQDPAVGELYDDRISEMWQAVRVNDVQLVRSLLEQGVNVNESDNEDLTPLHYAAHNGWSDLADTLLNFGADANARDLYGYTPLMVATRNGTTPVVRLLLKRGADPNIEVRQGTGSEVERITALKIAQQKGELEITALLEQYGAMK